MKVGIDKMVSIHYELSLDSGKMVDSSRENGQPLEFLYGRGTIIPALEEAIQGLEVGDKVQTKISAKDGYGERDESLVQSIPRNQVPEDIDLKTGMVLGGTNANGDRFQVVVQSFDENNVRIDLNHPLAGENLNFDVEVIAVAEAPEGKVEEK